MTNSQKCQCYELGNMFKRQIDKSALLCNHEKGFMPNDKWHLEIHMINATWFHGNVSNETNSCKMRSKSNKILKNVGWNSRRTLNMKKIHTMLSTMPCHTRGYLLLGIVSFFHNLYLFLKSSKIFLLVTWRPGHHIKSQVLEVGIYVMLKQFRPTINHAT